MTTNQRPDSLPKSAKPDEKRLSIVPPAYPRSLRYVDHYTEKSHVLANLADNNWKVACNGQMESLNFSRYAYDENLNEVVKAFALDFLSKYSTSTVQSYISGLCHFPTASLVDALELNPDAVRPFWDALRAQTFIPTAYRALKALLRFAAERSLGMWTPLYLPFVSVSLPLPSVDKHAAVRTGDVFLSVAEEATIVRWIYERAVKANLLSDKELTDTALIICCYQFAMRPIQIGLLRRRDSRILQAVHTSGKSVYLTFRMVKQKTAAAARSPLIRKVKREWAAIFFEIHIRNENESADSHLFGFTSADNVTRRINELLQSILKSCRTASVLRHSGAMRQVDAGASAEDLAEFMGHSSLESGLVYFDTSATQTQRVNEALGISETYQRLAKLGRERFITLEELGELKGEQQIAGVPHGISIAGIGGCSTGQPSCPYNPVTACYGCHKFMPVSNIAIHQQVLADFRGVVRFFFDASRGESESPAYLQLKRTISEVATVIDELECLHE